MDLHAQAADLLTTGQVARLFCVDPSTVTTWAKRGKLTTIRTLGGHRRYSRRQVEALLCGSELSQWEVPAQRRTEPPMPTAMAG
jgi:excisionase family DNA binding protein